MCWAREKDWGGGKTWVPLVLLGARTRTFRPVGEVKDSVDLPILRVSLHQRSKLLTCEKTWVMSAPTCRIFRMSSLS